MVREQTAHINRIKGLLFGQGIRGINVKSRYKTLKPAELVTGDGRPLPECLGREITREIERLALVQAQIVEVERERDKAPTPCVATALTQWFHHRTQGQKGRIRRVMIVALARKPAIAFWRYLETGPIPDPIPERCRRRIRLSIG